MFYSRSSGWSRALALVAATVALLVWTIPLSAADPGPTSVVHADLPITVSAGDFSLLNLILDFAPGAGAPDHVHGGNMIVTVLAGEITLRDQGSERIIRTGESWTEEPGHIHSVINAGTTTARVWIDALLPKGAELTTVQGNPQNPPPGPTVVYQAEFPIHIGAGEYTLNNDLLDFAPGAGVPEHFHGGNVLVTALDGEITLLEKGTQKVVKAGESWTEAPEARHAVTNASGANARVAVSTVLPRGADATTLVTLQTLPTTGAESNWSFALLFALIFATGVLGVGVWVWRRGAQS